MADASDPGDAGVHPSPGRDRARIEERRRPSNFREALTMVPGIEDVAGSFHWTRAASRTRPFAGYALRQRNRDATADACVDADEEDRHRSARAYAGL